MLRVSSASCSPRDLARREEGKEWLPWKHSSGKGAGTEGSVMQLNTGKPWSGGPHFSGFASPEHLPACPDAVSCSQNSLGRDWEVAAVSQPAVVTQTPSLTKEKQPSQHQLGLCSRAGGVTLSPPCAVPQGILCFPEGCPRRRERSSASTRCKAA